MKAMRLGFFLFALLWSAALPAQQANPDSNLNDMQKLGRRLYQQRCGVCHTPPTLTSKVFGAVLYRDVVAGNENASREFIKNGSKRMPGFKYELQPSEISAIVEYLKTVPKPSRVGSAGDNERVGDQ